MKKLNKLMAIGLSLVMCAGMIAPAFADDAYFYIKDGDAGWEFAGKGEVANSVEFDEENQAVGAVNDDGTLNTGVVTKPTGDSQGMQTIEGTGQVTKPIVGPKDVTVQVKVDTSKVDNLINQKNLTEGETEYVYDKSNGTDDVLDDQYTYSVTWEVKKENGADAYVDEITKTTSGGILGGIGGTTTYSGNSVPQADGSKKVVLSEAEGTEENPIKNDIHVDAIVKKSQNTEVKVEIKDFAGVGDNNELRYEDSGVDTGSKYIRQGTNIGDKDDNGKTVVDRATEIIVESLDKVNEEFYNHSDTRNTETGEITRTYTEKTFTVTYQSKTELNFEEKNETHGKVHDTHEVDTDVNANLKL